MAGTVSKTVRLADLLESIVQRALCALEAIEQTVHQASTKTNTARKSAKSVPQATNARDRLATQLLEKTRRTITWRSVGKCTTVHRLKQTLLTAQLATTLLVQWRLLWRIASFAQPDGFAMKTLDCISPRSLNAQEETTAAKAHMTP